jgi:Ca2+-binding EF-hand superfamily protein
VFHGCRPPVSGQGLFPVRPKSFGIDSNLASTWASSLFSKLDTQNKGYLKKTDLPSVLNSGSSNSDGAYTIEDIFKLIDGDRNRWAC